jgi:hypothetical protein
MQKSTATYFGQVPVEIVKKMAHEFSGANDLGDASVDSRQRMETFHLPVGLLCRGTLRIGASSKIGGLAAYPADLRELAQRIQEETDSNRMIVLVRQLIAKFDERQIQKRSGPTWEVRSPIGSGIGGFDEAGTGTMVEGEKPAGKEQANDDCRRGV